MPRFRWSRFTQQHTNRQRWMPRGADILADIHNELSLIADRRREPR